jgi:hypothetical protein
MKFFAFARLPALAFVVGLLTACATTTDTATATASITGNEEPLTGGLFGPALAPAEMQQAITAAGAFPLGSRKNPVRVNMPAGERGYLARLRCSDGRTPEFDRTGSVGTGPFGNILDLYAVRCTGGTPAKSDVYMDMYFGDYVESQPVGGFTIVQD